MWESKTLTKYSPQSENKYIKKKYPAYGRHQLSRPMQIVGPIQFWRGCMIYFYLKKNENKKKLPPHPPSPTKELLKGKGGGGHLEQLPVFRALLETTDPHQKADSVHAKIRTLSTPEHIPVFRALLETTDPHQKADSVHAKIWTRSTLRLGGGGHPEHIPVFRALLETTEPHQKRDLIHAKMLTRFTPEHIPVFRALLEIKIVLRNTSFFVGLYSRSRSRSNSGTHPHF